jgi:hypothetical protein
MTEAGPRAWILGCDMTSEIQNQSNEGDGSSVAQRWWVIPLMSAVLMEMALLGSLFVYHQQFAPRPIKFVVLDLHRIVDAKQLEFTSILTRPGVNEDDRSKALELVGEIEPQLKRALKLVREECNCQILVKAAALTSEEIPDVTQKVATLMNISDSNLAQAKEQIKRNISSTGEKK